MTRASFVLALAGLVSLHATGCKPNEGGRCNPLQFSVDDQCGAGLVCVYPPNCGVAFCCPPSRDMAGASGPPSCLFPPNCSGSNCCPTTGVTYTSNTSANCLPCPGPDASSQ
jgi:hypothetical protein